MYKWSCIMLFVDGVCKTSKTGHNHIYVICKNCTNMWSNYRRSEIKMRVYTQWLPNYQTGCTAPMVILNASRGSAVSSEPPNTFMAIRILHAKFWLVRKVNIVPFLYPPLSFAVPESSSLSMTHCQGKLKEWSSGWQATLLQMSTDCTSGNWMFYKHGHFLTNSPWCHYIIGGIASLTS